MQMTIDQCTICHDTWPIRLKTKRPENYICSRCSEDKTVLKKFSYENKMVLSDVLLELQNLTQTEEMLISTVLPIMQGRWPERLCCSLY